MFRVAYLQKTTLKFCSVCKIQLQNLSPISPMATKFSREGCVSDISVFCPVIQFQGEEFFKKIWCKFRLFFLFLGFCQIYWIYWRSFWHTKCHWSIVYYTQKISKISKFSNFQNQWIYGLIFWLRLVVHWILVFCTFPVGMVLPLAHDING